MSCFKHNRKKMSLTNTERKLVILFNTMTEDAQMWMLAKAVELADTFPTRELREAIIERHSDWSYH